MKEKLVRTVPISVVLVLAVMLMPGLKELLVDTMETIFFLIGGLIVLLSFLFGLVSGSYLELVLETERHKDFWGEWKYYKINKFSATKRFVIVGGTGMFVGILIAYLTPWMMTWPTWMYLGPLGEEVDFPSSSLCIFTLVLHYMGYYAMKKA